MQAPPETEIRPYNPAEIAAMVSMFRKAHQWTQETLAELAGITVRTVQRVEGGESSGLDSRRALAQAFGLGDMDAFNRSHPMVTPDGAAQAKKHFDQKFLILEVSPAGGREIVSAIVSSGPYRCIQTGAICIPPREVQDLYAHVMDFLQDVLDLADVAGNSEVLGYGDQVDGWIGEMKTHGYELGYGRRNVLLSSAKLKTVLSHVIALPVGGGLRHVAVEKDPRGGI